MIPWNQPCCLFSHQHLPDRPQGKEVSVLIIIGLTARRGRRRKGKGRGGESEYVCPAGPSTRRAPPCAAAERAADTSVRRAIGDRRSSSRLLRFSDRKQSGGRMCTRWYKYRVHTVTKLYGNSRYHSNRGCNALVPRTRRLISQSQPDDGQAGALQRRPPGPPRVRVPGVHLAACAGASSREVAHCMRARVRLWVSLRLLRACVRAARQTDLTARRVRVRASSWLGMLPSTAGKLQRPAHAAGVPRSRAACAPATTERRARGRALSAARGT